MEVLTFLVILSIVVLVVYKVWGNKKTSHKDKKPVKYPTDYPIWTLVEKDVFFGGNIQTVNQCPSTEKFAKCDLELDDECYLMGSKADHYDIYRCIHHKSND